MCGCVPLNAIGQLEHKYVENSCKKRGFNSYVPFTQKVSLVTQLKKWLLSLLFFRTLENVTLFGAEWGRGDLASPSPLLAGA